MQIVSFERRITVEEADAARIRVARALVDDVHKLGNNLIVTVDGRRCEATLSEDLCSCGGPERPHAHLFLTLRGDVPLEVARRVAVRIEAGT